MITASHGIEGGDFARAGSASRSLKELLRRIGVEAEVMRRAMIAAYEAEMNVVVHASRGTLWAKVNGDRLDLEVVDEGPGIPDIERALQRGYSTAGPEARALGFGAGMGLPSIRKCSDHFRIDSQVGRGTRVRSTILLRPGAVAESSGVSVQALPERCRGCLACLKACPTGAVRVRNLCPEVLAPLCVDCTDCIAACPSGAFGLRDLGGDTAAPVSASALVVPLAFLTGFGPSVSPSAVLGALAAAGFRSVRFTEEWESPLRRAIREAASQADVNALPLISPLCPAVINLLRVGFPSLLGRVAPFCSPVEALRDAYGLEAVTVVPACPSQQSLLEADSLPGRLRVLSPEQLRVLLHPHLFEAPDAAVPAVAVSGLRTPEEDEGSCPESSSGVLRVGGVRHVQRVLEAAEKGLLRGVDILELTACTAGCFGSPLFLEDPFLARTRYVRAAQSASAAPPVSAPPLPAPPVSGPLAGEVPRTDAISPRRGTRLDPDMAKAIQKLSRIETLTRGLPGRDCAVCGSPSCAALAEDIVLGRGRHEDCPYATNEEEPS